ncbi:MAG TPA: amino acid adenylation domain-containing protein [Ktedonobacteraceae bacterium]|nr:amino acid adenylation domain-containing protein [Ktedonobacteraceae bacterium]
MTQPGILSAKKLELLKARLKQKGINPPASTQVVARRQQSGPPPLSFAQQRLWFLDQLEPGMSTYNMPAAIRLNGVLDEAALEQSMNEIVRRHETLRTTFKVINEQPVQIIAPNLELSLSVRDLRAIPPSMREAETLRLAREDGAKPFNLEEGPLLRAQLLRLADNEHVLLLNIHHIVSDGWSLGVLVRELSSLYAAFAAGQPSPLPDLPVQYADFALWQRAWLQDMVLEQQLAYWHEQLAGAPSIIELPTDHPRPVAQTYRGAHLAFQVPLDLSQELTALSQREGVTIFMTLLSAFAVLLSRYSSQDDIVIGTPIANRRHTELEGLIGCFVNTLVMRTNLVGDPSFHQLLARVRAVCLQAYAHQDLPFEKLVDELAPERDLSHAPLFQVMFVLQNASSTVLELPGLRLQQLEIDSGTAKFDLLLSLSETSQGLRGVLEYSTDLFEAATIARMATHLQRLLAEIVADPDRQITALSLLDEYEREQVLVTWNATRHPYPQDQCFQQLFEAQVAHTPEALAVTCMGDQLTYRELNRHANRHARRLQSLGVGPETLVALLDERGINLLLAILAVFKAGGAYLPLDPLHPPARLRQLLQLSHASLLLCASQFSSIVAEVFSQKDSWEEQPRVLGLEQSLSQKELEADENENLPALNVPENLAYVIYTSGSTGIPKGAMIEQRGMINHLYAKINDLGLAGSDRVAQTASQCFDISIWQFLATLLVGGCVHIYPDTVAHDPLQLLAHIQHDSVTILETVPSFLRIMLETLNTDNVPNRALASLRWLIPTGEALPPELCERWWETYPHIPLLNAYGPTECSDDVTHFPFSQPLPVNTLHTPIGRPVNNMYIYILDHHLQPVPIGIPGELYIGGVGVGRGYLGAPQLTAQAFIPAPFGEQAGKRLYKTGDRARYLANGTIEFLGRVDYQVKLRGYRIELGEIEAVLKQHPAVRDAVAWVYKGSSGERTLVAYVVSQPEWFPTGESLRSHLQQRLPGYLVPSAFVTLKALPLTRNGKINYRALPELEYNHLERADVDDAPRTPAEEALASIWADVLRIEHIGIHDNFFELGGDSILSIQIISRAHEAGLHLTPRQVFQHQTIAALAAVVESDSSLPLPQSEQGNVRGSVELAPIQRWFFEQQFAEPQHFNQAVLLGLRPPVDRAALAQALLEIQRHHDALRMRFRPDTSGWQQENEGPEILEALLHQDLSTLSLEEQRQVIEASAAAYHGSLNLSEGPLLRAVFFDLGPQRISRLLLIIHHLIVDAVSWRILLADLQTAYQQLIRDEKVILPVKTTPFRQWAALLHEYAHSPLLQQETAYWLAEPRTRVSRLPLDTPGGDNTQDSARTIQVMLSTAETRVLLQEAPAAYQTQINDLLLTALVQAFARWTGNSRLLLDMETHGREEVVAQVDISRTVGWFTALAPVLLDLDGVDTPGAAIKAIKEQLRAIPNRGIGYGVLRFLNRDTALVESLRALPQAEVSFNYLGQFENVASKEAYFEAATESTGPAISHKARRSYLLDINSLVVDEQLRVECTYSEGLHHRTTIERLAQDFLEALRVLITHCTSSEAGGYTPSDFPQARLSQQTLDKLITKIGQMGRKETR